MRELTLEIQGEYLTALEGKRFDDARELVKGCPGLADTAIYEGRGNFMLAVDTNDYELVKQFLASGADVNALDVENFPILSRAVAKNREDSVRALLEYSPNLGRGGSSSVPLEWAFAGNTNAWPGNPRIAMRLIQAGALEAKEETNGLKPLANAMALGDENYIDFLLTNGADISDVIKNGAPVVPKAVRDCNWEPDFRRTGASVCMKVEDQQYQWETDYSRRTPEELLEFFSTSMNPLNEGMGMKVRIGNTPEAGLEQLYLLLSADVAQPLTSMEYWSQHGGADKGFEFVEALRRLIPDHLAYMRERIDCSELSREAATPREDSVTVSYMRGGGAEVGR